MALFGFGCALSEKHASSTSKLFLPFTLISYSLTVLQSSLCPFLFVKQPVMMSLFNHNFWTVLLAAFCSGGLELEQDRWWCHLVLSPCVTSSHSYLALYAYKPQKNDELELRKGEMYRVIEKCQDGWFKGTSLRSGMSGVFPGNYVTPVSRWGALACTELRGILEGTENNVTLLLNSPCRNSLVALQTSVMILAGCSIWVTMSSGDCTSCIRWWHF